MGTGSSLNPKLSSFLRASSAQNVGSTALCHGSNFNTWSGEDGGSPGETGEAIARADAGTGDLTSDCEVGAKKRDDLKSAENQNKRVCIF